MIHFTDEFPKGACFHCGGAIGEIEARLFWDGPMVSGVTMGGRCVACDIDYSLSVTNGVAELWRIDAPAKESLLHPLTESEIEVLNLKMQRYKALGPKWTSFMERRHGGDELWRYTRSHDGHTAIANVRSGIPISCFTVFGSL